MDKGAILFIAVISTVAIFILRLLLLDVKLRSYVKKYHRDYWEENIHSFLLGGRISVFQIVDRLNDPKIVDFKKRFYLVLKQLMLVVVIIVSLILVLIVLKLV